MLKGAATLLSELAVSALLFLQVVLPVLGLDLKEGTPGGGARRSERDVGQNANDGEWNGVEAIALQHATYTFYRLQGV